MMYKKNVTKTKDNKFGAKRQTEEKKPCKICEGLNKGSRYHTEEACWFRNKNIEQEKSTKTKNVNNNSVIEVDLNTDQKNETSHH